MGPGAVGGVADRGQGTTEVADFVAEGHPRRRKTDEWLDRWMDTVADLARLKRSHPMVDAVIDEVDGRRIRIGDRWLADFASCNYLGFDLDREIIEGIPAFLNAWGTHPSWSRLLGSPVLYERIEERLTTLLGCDDTLLLATITHIHMSVIPVLVGSGAVFVDGRAHKMIYDGYAIARGHAMKGRDRWRFRVTPPISTEGFGALGPLGRRLLEDPERATYPPKPAWVPPRGVSRGGGSGWPPSMADQASATSRCSGAAWTG